LANIPRNRPAAKLTGNSILFDAHSLCAGARKNRPIRVNIRRQGARRIGKEKSSGINSRPALLQSKRGPVPLPPRRQRRDFAAEKET